MKKTILSVAMALCATISFAQVKVDWSVDQIITPTALNSTVSGTQTPVNVVLKNLGTDSAKIGDSIFFSFYVAIGATAYIYWPTSNLTQVAFVKKLTKNLGVGDTVHFINNFNSGIGIYPSANATFRATSILLNRSRGLGYEATGTVANNSKTANIVWYNQQGWPVGIKNTEPATSEIYPTVASNLLTVNLHAMDLNHPVSLDVYDMMGKLVLSNTHIAGLDSYSVATDALSNGNYILQIRNGSISDSQKFIVNK